MPEMLQAEPTQKQQPTHATAFDPKQVRLRALSEVTLLLEKCRAQLLENPDHSDVISSFSMVIKSDYKEQIIGIYNAIIEESNYKLRKESAPFHLTGKLEGESFYFVAGYQEKKEADIHLNEETAKNLLALVNEDMRKREGSEKYKPRIQRLGSSIIRVLRENIDLQNEVQQILTPEELARGMLAFQKGETQEKPQANCIGISLLTNELLGLYGFDSSVISIHAISKYGEQADGHATAAVVADGWLIDPALLIAPKKISDIVLDKDSQKYAKFSGEMEGIYLPELGKNKPDETKPVALEYAEDKTDNELKSLFLLENGVKLWRQGKEAEGNESILQAAKLNPKSFYASYKAGVIAKERGGDAKTLFKGCSDLNQNMYLAGYYAALGLHSLAIETESKDLLAEAYSYSKRAFDMHPDYFFVAYQHIRIADELGNRTESHEIAKKINQIVPEGSEYRKLLEPYLAEKEK